MVVEPTPNQVRLPGKDVILSAKPEACFQLGPDNLLGNPPGILIYRVVTLLQGPQDLPLNIP